MCILDEAATRATRPVNNYRRMTYIQPVFSGRMIFEFLVANLVPSRRLVAKHDFEYPF